MTFVDHRCLESLHLSCYRRRTHLVLASWRTQWISIVVSWNRSSWPHNWVMIALSEALGEVEY